MGIGRALKKAVKDVVGTVASPLAVLGPAGASFGIVDNVKEKRKEEQALARLRQNIAVDQTEKIKFNDTLEEERRSGGKSKVLFAGVLGEKASVGLGGKKSLLGL